MFTPLRREDFFWDESFERRWYLCGMNRSKRDPKTALVLIRQLHLEAIFSFNKWIQNYFIIVKVRPILPGFSFIRNNDIFDTLRLKKKRNGYDDFVKTFSQLQEIFCSIARDKAIGSCIRISARMEI